MAGMAGGEEVWTTLYEGRASIVAGGSSPFYGGGMKLFPFARARPDLMHMRIAAISPFRFVPNVWGIFRGTYRIRNGAFDFIGPAFKIELRGKDKADGVPFQQSGDTVGRRCSTTMRCCGGVRFVDFWGLPPRLANLRCEEGQLEEELRSGGTYV
mmetsp:Transcript_8998/g.19050  ORF Transcript_8998/g.19050 Transcript_8998/m.19050 type:complete len:155 (-) Transcript_8998:90-554(-)